MHDLDQPLSGRPTHLVSAQLGTLAHPPRGDASHVFGSVMFEAAADLVLQVSAQVNTDGKSMGVSVQGDKANDVPRQRMAIYALRFDDYGLSEFRQAKQGEFPELEAKKKRNVADEVADYLLEHGATSPSDIDIGRARSTIVETLRHDDRFAVISRNGHKKLYGVKSPDSSSSESSADTKAMI